MKRYDEIDHTADIAARVYGRGYSDIFANAAFCMFDMIGELNSDDTKNTITIEVESENMENLLVKWLNELLYVSFDKKILFSEFNILYLDPNKVKGQVSGASYSGKETLLKKEIKAATYHDVEIKKTARGYEVVIVFDV